MTGFVRGEEHVCFRPDACLTQINTNACRDHQHFTEYSFPFLGGRSKRMILYFSSCRLSLFPCYPLEMGASNPGGVGVGDSKRLPPDTSDNSSSLNLSLSSGDSFSVLSFLVSSTVLLGGLLKP